MSEVSDLCKEELTALARAVELWDELFTVLGRIEARPGGDGVLHIETEVQPGYLGWIGYGEGGSIVFQPAPPPATEEDK